ncbi:MAG: hypothetical protein KJ666_14175 [Bacteroidetes bacterium]|nr:hypothetical protein [Bacteroidota bacterium]MBU2584856.1 hypothetical protein [Bacteroidota bacterium]
MKTEPSDIIKKFASTKDYFSLDQLREHLNSLMLDYSDIAIKKYLKNISDQKIIFSAGRGYYSTIPKVLELSDENLQSLIEVIIQKYPFVKFSVWSTKTISFAFHHLQNRFYTFILAEKDALIFLRDFLVEKKYDVYLNPSPDELDKNVLLKDGSIILRPSVTRSKAISNIASIEQILIDFYVEKDRLKLIDESEYKRVFSYIISNFRISISSLLTYAERRKIHAEMKLFIEKYTNATFG